MKKLYLFLILLIFPFIAHAEVDYDITDYYITSDIEVAGGLKIKELVVLDGTFNGYERNIVYRNDNHKIKARENFPLPLLFPNIIKSVNEQIVQFLKMSDRIFS